MRHSADPSHKIETPPAILIYRDLLLPPSEMFILRMAESLSRYRPYYVGLRRTSGIVPPPARTMLINPYSQKCNAREALFRYCGWVPRELRRRLLDTQPVLVHAQFGWDGVRGLILAQNLQLPLIVHYRGHDATIADSRTKLHSRNARQYLRRREKLRSGAALFITVSNFIRRKLEEQGFPPEEIVTHYTGIDLKFFQPDYTIERRPIVLFAGRLTRYKGCDFLIQAMAQVQEAQPEMELIIVGDGDLRQDLERLASVSLKHYRFLGWVGQESLREWMARSRVLAFPSITADWGESEGLGNVALEAQAMGLPVVGHLHGGIPEAVRNGETGILVRERDTKALASAILELATDEGLWQRFSAAGQQHVRANFDLRRRNQVLERHYDDVLKHRRVESPVRVPSEQAQVGIRTGP